MSVCSLAREALDRIHPVRITGRVSGIRGLSVLVDDLPLPVGALVRIAHSEHRTTHDAVEPAHERHERRVNVEPHEVWGEVVGASRDQSIVMLLGSPSGLRAGDLVSGYATAPSVRVGPGLLGRVVNALMEPLDGKGPIVGGEPRSLHAEPIPALRRAPVREPLLTGVRAIDLITPIGRGQRLGVFAGPGVGKSTLLGTIARRTSADVNVIALIGERGREVGDFIEKSLGEEGMARSVVVVATGDEQATMRLRASRAACSIAEWFRDRGLDVLLMMDSVTRFAHAQRQLGLAAGEPPSAKGYTPSVFAQLGQLLERAGAVKPAGPAAKGASAGGSITGLYTILVEGDDMTEPIADAARGILDGHLVLSRRLAQENHYPAIDVMDSISRLAEDVSDRAQTNARRQLLRLMALHAEVEDIIRIGAYARGVDPETDIAVDMHPAIVALLRQSRDEHEPIVKSHATLLKLANEAAEKLGRAQRSRGVNPVGTSSAK
ncbi:MAG: FliI/YscN family ATPase [Planctomycetota bacterium]|nr:FliI/YscN family ATPase [Planctomycetota bacterium]